LKKVGQGVLEFMIGNEKVTDRQTDQTTCAKQNALSSSKGGIITGLIKHQHKSLYNENTKVQTYKYTSIHSRVNCL